MEDLLDDLMSLQSQPNCITDEDGHVPVILLGMHRSGTSYLASFVNAWGVSIGDHLLSPAEDNPRGYFEDEEFVRFHSEVLERQCGQPLTFHELGPIHFRDQPDLSLTEQERNRGADLAKARSRKAIWGWKDPRTCLFLDYWRSMFPKAILIAVYRHPLEVYGSEVRRRMEDLSFDGTIPIDSWTVYNRCILSAWRSHEGPKLMMGAGAVFGNKPQMELLISQVLGPLMEERRSFLPEFSPHEFQDWRISKGAHECFSEIFPAAAEVFDELQSLSAARLALVPDVEPWCASFVEHSRFVVRKHESGRGFLLPLLASRINPAFLPDWAALQIKVQEDWTARVRSYLGGISKIHKLREQIDQLQARVNRWQQREQEVRVERRKSEEKRIQLGAEVTEWRAQYLVSRVLEPARSGRPIFLWADNSLAFRVRELLANTRIPVVLTVDRDGPPAASPAALRPLAGATGPSRPFVAVCSASARSSICDELREMGMVMDVDYVALPDEESVREGLFLPNPRL